MSFRDLQGKLIELARRRVHAGQLTERGLARKCGISQPHIHNVLKGIRALSAESADRLMEALNVRISDLLWNPAGQDGGSFRAVPIIQSRLGPGSEPSFTQFRGYMPFPEALLADLVEPLAVRLAPDLLLPRSLATDDLVLLDRNPVVRAEPRNGSLWIVSESGGMRARYIYRAGARLCIANEATLRRPGEWQAPPPGQNILDIVRARIVWISREMEAGELETGAL